MPVYEGDGGGAERGRASCVLSEEASARGVRTLRCWGRTERGRVAEIVGGVVRQWRLEWGVGGVGPSEAEPPLRCEVLDAADGEPCLRDWQPLDESGGGIWWRVARTRQGEASEHAQEARELEVVVARAIYGDEAANEPAGGLWIQTSGIGAALVKDGARDLQGRLVRAFPRAPVGSAAKEGASVRDAVLRWSGALRVVVAMPRGGLELLLTHERTCGALGVMVERQGRRSEAGVKGLRPLMVALSNKVLKVQAELECFEVELGELMSLRVSDVLLTTQALEAPLCVGVVSPGGTRAVPVCGGHLGRVGPVRAVELVIETPVRSMMDESA